MKSEREKEKRENERGRKAEQERRQEMHVTKGEEKIRDGRSEERQGVL